MEPARVFVTIYLVVCVVATCGSAASLPKVPRRVDIPCYSEDRRMFMWTDFRCHDLTECGVGHSYSGVDVQRMVEFNENNPLAPAQPCRCLASQAGRRVPSGDTTLLPDNCGDCGGYVPLAERPDGLAHPSFLEDARCQTVPRGDLRAASDPALAREEADPTTREGDFFCLAADPVCQAQVPSRTVDALWRPLNTSLDPSGAPVAAFYGFSHNMALAAEGATAFEQCGPQTDMAATLRDARCRCVRNADTEAASWAPPDYATWVDVHTKSTAYTMCSRCSDGYHELWEDWTNTCHLDQLQCAIDHPDAPLLLQSSLSPDQLDMDVGTSLHRCVDPNTFCSPGASSPRHDYDASVAAQRCVCSSVAGLPALGGPWTHPSHPELGPQTVCTLCNNAAGHFALGASTMCQWSLEYFTEAAHRSELGTQVASMATYRIERIREFVFEAWHTDQYGTLYGVPRWPEGLDWPGSSSQRMGIAEYWAPYPVPDTVWSTTGITGSRHLPVAAGGNPADRGAWFASIITGAQAPDASPTARALFTWWACGQAADVQQPDSPLQCRCVSHASKRPVLPAYPLQGTVYHYRDDCFCDDGYAFDRLANQASPDAAIASTGACVPHADVCGGAAFKDITYTCVCLPEAEKDANGRCTVCKGGRFRPLDACPLIHEWCQLPTTSLVGLDVELTKSTGTCTCNATAGLRPFDAQAGDTPGCYSCVQPGQTFDPTIGDGACVPTTSACPDTTGRLDVTVTESTSVCSCLRGWHYASGEGCTRVPDGSWVDTETDMVWPWSKCGEGVDGPATTAQGRCVCNTDAHWSADDCSVCAEGYLQVRNPDTNVLECLVAEEACGTGIDTDQTYAARACVCGPHFLSFDQQPSGQCEDCQEPYYRRAVFPATCEPPTEDDRMYGGQVLDLPAYSRLLDMAFQNGAEVFHDDTPLDCGATWSQQPNEWHPHYLLQLPSTAPAVLKTVVHNLEEARIACHAYFPCTGFLAFRLTEVSGITLYFLLYTTGHPSTSTTGAVVYTPQTNAYALMEYADTWELSRMDERQCIDASVDPAWYWSAWQQRVRQNNWAFVSFSANTTARFGASVRAALHEPEAVVQHFHWRGHLARLWPNPNCKLGPVRADARTGCRAQTCPTFSVCPFTHPAGGEASSGNVCFLPSTPLPSDVLDVPGWQAAWSNSTYATYATQATVHPPACREGMCLFDVQSTTSSVVRTSCACPGTGTSHNQAHACDTTLNTLRDEGSGVCRFPLLTAGEHADCGLETGACPPGRFGAQCALADTDHFCHPPGATDMCNARGTCQPGIVPQSPWCQCEEGWSGKYCQHQTCDQGCGPYGRCVAASSNDPGSNATEPSMDQTACLCAVHATLGEPLSLPDPLTGRCDVDLCNDHLGGSARRYGTLTLSTTGATDAQGAPLATCTCTKNSAGIQNGGLLCDEPACANGCGLPGGAQHPAYADVCARCTDLEPGSSPLCDQSLLGVGAVCDCDGSLRQGMEYWQTKPWRYTTSTTPWVSEALSFPQCAAACGGGGTSAVGKGQWDPFGQTCTCTDDTVRGPWCETPSCPHGVYSRAQDECVQCDPQFQLTRVDGRAECSVCAVGYTTDDTDTSAGPCQSCSPGFIRSDTPTGPLCQLCEDIGRDTCNSMGTEAIACYPTRIQCECAPGYTGPACDQCVFPLWYVTQAILDRGMVNGTLWSLGSCAPLDAWECAPGTTSNITYQPGESHPTCECVAPFSNVQHASTGDPGDCSKCSPGFLQQHDPVQGRSFCIPCTEALACDPSGTLRAECPNPGAWMGAGMDNGLPNVCVCDVDGGRTGERCHECNTDTKWVPIPNTDPLVCKHCARDCGPHGEVMCGVSSATCRCRGAWTGIACDKCLACGPGGDCLPAARDGDPWCSCRTAQGYAKHPALLGTPDEYRAPCTACLPGFFLRGTRCLSVTETCGPGADTIETQRTGACVCASTYLPLQEQLSNRCETCAVAHVLGTNGTCAVCEPACGTHASCVWDSTNARPGCECDPGWQEHQGACSQCADGYHGPQCLPCPTACSDAPSSGTCQWNPTTQSMDCLCPEGSRNSLPGAPDSPCQPCIPALETGPRCIAIVTCPANAQSVINGSVSTCECMEGFVPKFSGGHPLLTPCVDAPETVTLEAAQAAADSALFAMFDLATAAFVLGSIAMGMLLCSGLFVLALHCLGSVQPRTDGTTKRSLPTTPPPPPPPPPPRQTQFAHRMHLPHTTTEWRQRRTATVTHTTQRGRKRW